MHKSKETMKLIRQAEKEGFYVEWKSKNHVGMMYPPDKDYPPHLVHVGPLAVMPLKSYLRKYRKSH